MRTTRVLVTDLPSPEGPSHFETRTSDHLPPIHCEVVRDFRRLEELSTAWARLWKSDPHGEIFQSPEWAMAWWRAFGSQNELCSIVVFAGDEVIGILPLVQQDGVIRFLGTPDADYADIICEEERTSEVLTAALSTLSNSVSGWTECDLEHLSENSRVVRHYRELPASLMTRLHCVPTEQYQIIASRDKNDRAFDSLMGKHHTRRRRNKLQKSGQPRFRHFETQEEAEAHLSDFFRHHIRRFAATGRQSRCACPEFRQFLRALLEQMSPTEGLRFGVLELDSRPLAWYYGFEANGKFLLYQHTFDVDASDFTPGELLLWNLLAHAKDHAIREFDFGTGDELYKSRFSTEQRKTFSVFFEPPRFGGRVRGFRRGVQGYLQPLFGQMRRAARNRATMRAFRSLRMWTMGTIAGMRRAEQKGVLGRYARHFVRKLVRDGVWSRQSIEVFGSEALCRSTFAKTAGNGSHALEVNQPSYGDLVELAWEHPDILLPSELPGCRKRLKKGDGAYVIGNESGVALMCWTSTSQVDRAVPGTSIQPDSRVLLIDESWRAHNCDAAAAYQALLSQLAEQACQAQGNVPVYCGSNQPALRRELKRQGFAPQFKITRYTALGRFQGELVRSNQK